MNVADWVIVAVVVFGAWEGYRAGFVRQLVRLFGTVLAYVAAWQLGPLLVPTIDTWVLHTLLKDVHSASAVPVVGMLSGGNTVPALARTIAGALAFGAVFLVSLILIRYLGHLLNAVFSLPLLSWVNRLLGLAVGVIVALLILAVVIDVASYLPASPVKAQIKHSVLVPLFAQPVSELQRWEGTIAHTR